MRIEFCYNTSETEIDSGKWNPYLGISIQNKYFTTEYLAEFVNWAVPRSSQRAAIVVVDILQRVNNEIFDRSSPISALSKAFRKADEIHERIDAVFAAQPAGIREKVAILDWCDIVDETYFIHNYRLLKGQFETNEQFRDFLIGLTRSNLGPIVGRLNADDVEHLSRYVLMELPELITGFVHGDIHYDLNVYPGPISKIYLELSQQDFWGDIRKELRFIGPFGSAEAFL
jgi:tRNA-dependent cyclodipeptide synthase